MTGNAVRLELTTSRTVAGFGNVRETHVFGCRPPADLIGPRLVAAALPAFPDPAAVWRFLDAVLVDGAATRLRQLVTDPGNDLDLPRLTAGALAVRRRYDRR